MKNKIIYGLVLLPFIIPSMVYAGNSVVLTDMCNLLAKIAVWLISIGYIASIITLARFSISASILGKFPAPNFITWMAGVFVLSMVIPIISYITNQSFSFQCGISFSVY